MRHGVFFALIATLTLALCGCGGPDVGLSPSDNPIGAYSGVGERETVTVPPRDEISMVFYEDMDSNPLTTTNSENHELLKLVYSPLIRLNGALEPEYVLAESVSISGTGVQIRLRGGLHFSDGSAVTAEDVAASFRTVRANDKSPYYARLQNVQRFTVTDNLTLSLTLSAPDTDFINCLDIPVMQKNGTAGCGPYQFSERNGQRVLEPNPQYFTQPTIQTIRLKKPTDDAERQKMFSVGLLDVYFMPAESEQVFSGGKEYRIQTYQSDNLLFLGVNCQHETLAHSGVRAFLSTLIDRDRIADNVLLGQASSSAYPFQPTWYKAASLTQNKVPDDLVKREQAAALGFSLTENTLRDGNGEQLVLSLLVAEGSTAHRAVAQAVADSLALSGVKINLETVPRENYNARLQAGEYDLYLGEVKTGRTLNTALYAAGSAINYGNFNAPELEEAAAQYRAGSKTLDDFAAVFDRFTPIMPLVYREGVLFAAADIGTFGSTGTWSVYGDITKLITLETEEEKK